MKHQNFETATKMTAITFPVYAARRASAETASAMSDYYAGIKLRIDAETPKSAPLGSRRAEARAFAQFA